MPSRTKKFRGSRTHGRGQKSGRGAGKRGGKGMAGLHKHKWIWTVKYAPDYFGRKGFKRPPEIQKKKTAINLYEIEDKKLQPTELEGKQVLNLTALGYDKLLGCGKITKPLTIIVSQASKNAVEKIKNAGGEVYSCAMRRKM